jgi:hypothetical protein
MTSTIVNTLMGFGLDSEEAVDIASGVGVILDKSIGERNELSSEIETLMRRYEALDAKVKRLEAALAAEETDTVVPFHGLGGGGSQK